MFKSLKRITYQASDLEKARQWYTRLLNVQPLFDNPFVVVYRVGDCSLSIIKMNTPINDPAGQTETFWEVEDIDYSFHELLRLGATQHSPIKDVLNIRTAKVIDPFGNIIGITGLPLDVKKRSVENKPSESALIVTYCRALSANDEREEIKGPDFLAEYFLSEEGRKSLKSSVSRKWTIQKMITSPKYGFIISRTAFFDSIYKKTLDENIGQIVILGAGYDTRPYRFPDTSGKKRIFEVDIQSTQKRKIDILQNNKIDIPEQLTFVSTNFETDNLEEVLLNSGFDNTVKTLFLWEGVTYYLSKDTINKTLNFIHSNSAKGSIVCFDYLAEKIESMNAAEPYQFIIGKHELEEFLSERKFNIIENIDSKEMEKRFLTLKDGTLAEKSLTHFCFVSANTT
jgi:methyltransferase (TIGR00027 family)